MIIYKLVNINLQIGKYNLQIGKCNLRIGSVTTCNLRISKY